MLSCGWEVTRIWAHRNSFFHMHLSASILFLHPELSFLGAHHREWLQSDGCLVAGILLLPEFPQGSSAHIGRAADADDCDILVY